MFAKSICLSYNVSGYYGRIVIRNIKVSVFGLMQLNIEAEATKCSRYFIKYRGSFGK